MIGAKRSTLHLFCMYLPHSDAIFVKAYPAEMTEALLAGVGIPAVRRNRGFSTT